MMKPAPVFLFFLAFLIFACQSFAAEKSFSPNAGLWQSIDQLNEDFSQGKKNVDKIFSEAVQILAGTLLEDEFEKLRTIAYESNDFEVLDSLVDRAAPVFEVMIIGESNSIGIRMDEFIPKMPSDSVEAAFFDLASHGFYIKNKSCIPICGTADLPQWLKRTGASFGAKADTNTARAYLKDWQDLLPRLSGIYRTTAEDTIAAINEGIK